MTSRNKTSQIQVDASKKNETSLIRISIDANSRVKRFRWIFFSLLVIGLFSAVIFIDYQSLLEDSTKVRDSYLMLEISKLKTEKTKWTNTNPQVGNDTLEEKIVDWDAFEYSGSDLLLDRVAEFLYKTKWKNIELAYLHANKQLMTAEFSLKGNEITEPIIVSRRKFLDKMAMHGSIKEKKVRNYIASACPETCKSLKNNKKNL